MAEIVEIRGRQVWDSRGRPTVEAEVRLASGVVGRSIAPSGASTGSREALDRRDGGTRLGGYGVDGAIAAINGEIGDTLKGLLATDQRVVDNALIDLDGTPQKSSLGGNATIAVSQAVAWAAANERGLPLWQHLRTLAGLDAMDGHIPAPMIQIFGGGRHAGNRIDIQDYLIVANGAASFAQATEWIAEVYARAARDMADRGKMHGVADEGGIWPDFSANEEGLERITLAIEGAGFVPGRDIGIALDIAATSFHTPQGYRLALENRTLDSGALIDLLAGWADAYPILSLEDPLAEDDDEGFAEITGRLAPKVTIVGDDYLTTSVERIDRAATRGACNAVLLKANQCGTVTELIAASSAARRLGWHTIQSGRSGESEDVTLSHLAVGLMSDQIKVGSMTRSERTAKWNEVIRISENFDVPHYWHREID